MLMLHPSPMSVVTYAPPCCGMATGRSKRRDRRVVLANDEGPGLGVVGLCRVADGGNAFERLFGSRQCFQKAIHIRAHGA